MLKFYCTSCKKSEAKFKVCCSTKKYLQHLCKKCFIKEYHDGDYTEDKEEFNNSILINSDESLDNAYAVANSYYYSQEYDWEESHKDVYIYFTKQNLYVKEDLSLTPNKKEAHLFSRSFDIMYKTFELDDLKLKNFPEIIFNKYFTKFDLPNKKKNLEFILRKYYFKTNNKSSMEDINILTITNENYNKYLYVKIKDNKLILSNNTEGNEEFNTELLNKEEMNLPIEYSIAFNDFLTFKYKTPSLIWPFPFEEKLISSLKTHLNLKNSEIEFDIDGIIEEGEEEYKIFNEHYFEDIKEEPNFRSLNCYIYLDRNEKISNKKLKSFTFEYENEDYIMNLNIFKITNQETSEEKEINDSIVM